MYINRGIIHIKHQTVFNPLSVNIVYKSNFFFKMFKYIVVVLAMLLGLACAAPNPAPVASPNPNPSIVPLGLPLPLGPVVVAGPRLIPGSIVVGPYGPVVVG